MNLRIVSAVLAIGSLAAPAHAQRAARPSSSDVSASFATPALYGEGVPSATEVASQRFRGRMVALRQEALRLRAADGGSLTAEHDAMIQRRLDAIHADLAPYITPIR
jgi:hypothetical protein